MENFEVVKCGPYRFIGKAIYVRAGKSDDLCGTLFKHYGDWVFKTLGGMKEYATDEIHNAAFLSWDKYDDKNQLMGYIAGRFMKADTPVPDDMDYIDVPEGYIAKGFVTGEDVGKACKTVRDEIARQGIYKGSSQLWWSAEIYPEPDGKGGPVVGYYESYELK